MHVSDKKHDITVGLFVAHEALLLNHLRVVDEADELPHAQVNDTLWHIQR